MSGDTARYGIDELAELGGVSRRTVRYYVQERLLPPPLGVGRGRHYGRAHLDALLRVKSMQEAGLTLDFRLRLGDWSVLVLRRGRRKPASRRAGKK